MRVVRINQFGVFLGMGAVAASMAKAGGGSIINVSSIAGLVAYPGLSAYAASKFAVTGMTKVAALDLAKYRVRVNAVHPGMTLTRLLEGPEGVNAEQQRQIEAMLPLGRFATPEELAATIAFLASEESSYCTGASLAVDGGWTAV